MSNKELDGIIKGDTQLLENLYKNDFPRIQAFVIKNQGTKEQAADLFHDALIAIFRKAQTPGFAITCRLSTYLYAVCKNLWLKELRQRRHTREIQSDDMPHVESIEERIMTNESGQLKKEVFDRCFALLTSDCQKLLKMAMEGKDADHTLEKMQYNSKQHALNRRYRCKKALMRFVRQDPFFKELFPL